MRLRDHYDWIVLGDDPGALLSASLAAKLGLSVLVLPLHSKSNLRIVSGGERSEESVLDLETSWIPGLSDGGLWDACLKQAGIAPQERAQISESLAFTQVVTPRGRVSIESDRSRLATEFERELGAERAEKSGLLDALKQADAEIDKYWLDLPERLTLRTSRSEAKGAKKATVGNTLSKLSDYLSRNTDRSLPAAKPWFSQELSIEKWAAKNHQYELAEILEGIQSAASSSQGSQSSSLFSVLQLLSLSRTSAAYQGGLTAFREFLLSLARRNGADIPAKTECRRIFVQSGRFAGVLPSIRGSMIGATGGILGAPMEQVQSMLTQSGRGWLRGFKSPLRAVGWKFSVALTLHPEAIPPGMARRVIWQEKGAPFLEIERIHPSEYHLKDGNRVIVFLRTLMPMTEESLTPAFQRLTGARLLRKAAEISPFLEFHIRRIFPDFRTPEARELHEVYGFKSLREIPPSLLCYSGKGLGAQSGVEGLFLSSLECFPSMGMQGGAISALEGVAWVAHRSGLAGPFKS